MNLPKEVIERDKMLVARASELAHLRWHWTLDETNSKRVSFSEYARQVGVIESSIRSQARAWEEYNSRPGARKPGQPSSFEDFKQRQHMSEENSQAAEALARHTGKSYGNIAKHHRNEVRSVVEMARDRADRKGTTFEYEVDKVAETRQASRDRLDKEKDWKRKHLRSECFKMQTCLGYAITRVREAYEIAQDLEFGDDEIEILSHTLSSLRALVNLLDRRVLGKEHVDWDAELKRLVNEYEEKEA